MFSLVVELHGMYGWRRAGFIKRMSYLRVSSFLCLVRKGLLWKRKALEEFTPRKMQQQPPSLLLPPLPSRRSAQEQHSDGCVYIPLHSSGLMYFVFNWQSGLFMEKHLFNRGDGLAGQRDHHCPQLWLLCCRWCCSICCCCRMKSMPWCWLLLNRFGFTVQLSGNLHVLHFKHLSAKSITQFIELKLNGNCFDGNSFRIGVSAPAVSELRNTLFSSQSNLGFFCHHLA